MQTFLMHSKGTTCLKQSELQEQLHVDNCPI